MPNLLNARREFLWQAGGGFAGLALTALLAEDGFFEPSRLRALTQPGSPLSPARP